MVNNTYGDFDKTLLAEKKMILDMLHLKSKIPNVHEIMESVISL